MTTRWGIAATGGMAAAFASDLVLTGDAEIAFVGSRTPSSAAAFAERFGAPGSGTYRDLVEAGRGGEVDVVYLATPHPQHHDLALAAIEAGTPLLVEKAFTATLAGSRGGGRRRPRRGGVLHGGHVDPLPAGRRPRSVTSSPPVTSGRCCWCRPTSARSATSTRRAGSSTSRSAAARSSTSASTRSPWPSTSSAAPTASRRPARPTPTARTARRHPAVVRRRAGRVADLHAGQPDARPRDRRGHRGLDRGGPAVLPPQHPRRTTQRGGARGGRAPAHRPRLRPPGRGGAALPRRGAHREPAHAAAGHPRRDVGARGGPRAARHHDGRGDRRAVSAAHEADAARYGAERLPRVRA